jgi:hypothetical protein
MSKTITSLIMIAAGFAGVGDIFLEGEVATVVNAVLQVGGIVGAWIGRVKASGRVDWLGRKG